MAFGTDYPLRPLSPAELGKLLEAEQNAAAFIALRGPDGSLRIVPLPESSERVTLGRDLTADIVVEGDGQLSRIHTELHSVGSEWLMADDGLSRNGTFVNGERIQNRTRLRDGDTIRVGSTVLVFGDARSAMEQTRTTHDVDRPLTVSPAQRKILAALCAPLRSADSRADHLALPATNDEIASSLCLSVDAVKAHLRVLYARFGLADLPPHRKRVHLAQSALRQGLS
jgi:DNA-binding CsgD family transcriptional regulator